MANPLACAAALASLDLFASEPRLHQVASISAQLTEGLAPCRALPGVRDVRVLGAIGVVELAAIPDMNALKAALLAQGVWIRPFGKIIYLTPAFTIDPADLNLLMRAVHTAIAATAISPKD
jgi:adenosylmethionine-8-amino-7-oxononanoate aminotransferase